MKSGFKSVPNALFWEYNYSLVPLQFDSFFPDYNMLKSRLTKFCSVNKEFLLGVVVGGDFFFQENVSEWLNHFSTKRP